MSARALYRRSVWKSSKTNSIGEGKCNTNCTMPEEMRDLIDSTLVNGQSRNSKLMEMILFFFKENNQSAHAQALAILQAHQVMRGIASVFFLGLLWFMMINADQPDMRRASRGSSRVKGNQTAKGSRGRKTDGPFEQFEIGVSA